MTIASHEQQLPGGRRMSGVRRLGFTSAMLTLGCGSVEPTIPPEPSFSYSVTYTTGDVLTFSGTSAAWVTLALGGSGQPPYSFEVTLAQPAQSGVSDELYYPLLSIRANGSGFRTYPQPTTLRLGSGNGDVIMAGIGNFIGDSGSVTLRPINTTVLEGSLDLWFTSAGNYFPPPSIHLVGTFLAIGQNFIR